MSTSDYRTLIPLFDELYGARVLLRPYRESDAEALFDAVEESRDYLQEWIGFSHGHQSLEQTRDWILRQNAKWLLREDFPAGIWDIASNQFLGDCRLFPQSWKTHYFSFSYWLRVSAVGYGYMTEALQLWIDYAFRELQATRLEISCDARNIASARVALRLGFVQEGALRNHVLDSDGKLRTSLIFGRIPGDPVP